MRGAFTFRIRILSGIVLLVALLYIGRLYVVQIAHGDTYAHKADRQYASGSAKLYDRGSIFFEDKNGNRISAATLKEGYTLALVPTEITDAADLYNILSNYIELEEEEFLKRALKKDDPYEELLHRLPKEKADQIKEQNLDGVRLYRERWRYYPGSELAAQTVGFVGYQGDDFSGRYGLERYYNDILEREGETAYINFFAEIFSSAQEFFGDESRSGDLVTSIEPSVQLFLEKKLSEIQDDWDSKISGGIIINPQTGAIYALGLRPSFNPNNLSEVESTSVFGNPLVEGVYELGSIMKPITMAVGLDTGAVSAHTTYYDHGTLDVDGYTISNYDGKGRGKVSMQEVLNQSLNTGVSFVVSEVGTETFSDYLKRLGIGEETGIDLPGEQPGLIDNLDSPRQVEYATASFGQGIALSPISMVRALTALANDGVPVTPHVGKRVVYAPGIGKDIGFGKEDQIFKKETSEEITRMLVEVVDSSLLGGTVALPNYSIAAKTGTAQIAKEGARGYYDDRFLHSFFGYVPAYDPQFLVFLYTTEPVGVRYASQTLTLPFMDIVQFLINYYSITPDR